MEILDGAMFKNMFLNGAQLLTKNRDHVDALNVFPVPDGDTGTNMSLTLTAAVKEIQSMESNSLGNIVEAVARGSLMGARGNSGVILSQLIRGMAKELKSMDKVGARLFAQSLETGLETAVQAVMKPMEGTILTVAREAAKAAVAEARRTNDLTRVMQETVKVANKVLAKTQEMLPVLKQAGVVDAGAKGWVLFLEGMYQGLTGEIPTVEAPEERVTPRNDVQTAQAAEEYSDFGYCTELFIFNPRSNADTVRNALANLGDSLLVVGEPDLIKVHIHSDHPGKVLEKCLEYGVIDKIKIENMTNQAVEKAANTKDATDMKVDAADAVDAAGVGDDPDTAAAPEAKPYGFVVVSSGDGLEQIFKSLGADKIVSGGQTNNPSTEELVTAINQVGAETVYVLPNNGNVVLTAGQAAQLADCKVIVVPSKSIPQGISAMVAFQPEKDEETNAARMLKAAKAVKTGEVTYAVRSTEIDGHLIEKDDIIGLVDDQIVATGKEVAQVTKELVGAMMDDDSEILTLYSGQDMQEDTVDAIVQSLQEEYPDLEVESHRGGQPLYYFLLSLE